MTIRRSRSGPADPSPAPRCAGLYARLSLDVDGNGLAVTRQIEDGEAVAARLGWEVVDRYVDNSVSASKAVARPEYERLLNDLRAGRIDAVIVYDLDRLTRKPIELEEFIDLADGLGVQLANVAGDVDLWTGEGRMMARIKGAVARQEVDRLGQRVKRQKQQRLASGLPPGSRWRTFGYSRGWALLADEAEIVREVFERIAGGESVNSVTKDLTARGVRRVSGEPWAYAATVRMVDSRIYAGRLSYKGADAGQASVPGIVSEAVLEAAQRRQRSPGRVNGRKHLLSGLVVCHRCHAVMTVTGQASAAWVCNRQAGGCGNVRLKRSWVEAAVEDWTKTRLIFEDLKPNPADTSHGEDAARSAALGVIDARIERTRSAMTAGALDYPDGLPMLKDLRGQRAALVKSQASAEAVQQQFLKSLSDYEVAEVGQRAAEVRRRISAVLVFPTTKRGSTLFDPARFEVVLVDGRRVPGAVFVEEAARFRDLPASSNVGGAA